MNIMDMAEDAGGNVFYTESFRNLLESYLNVLINRSDTQVVTIDPQLGFKHEFDLYGLLAYYGVPVKHRWITARMSGFNSSEEYRGEVIQLYVPNFDNIERLRSLHMSKNGK